MHGRVRRWWWWWWWWWWMVGTLLFGLQSLLLALFGDPKLWREWLPLPD